MRWEELPVGWQTSSAEANLPHSSEYFLLCLPSFFLKFPHLSQRPRLSLNVCASKICLYVSFVSLEKAHILGSAGPCLNSPWLSWLVIVQIAFYKIFLNLLKKKIIVFSPKYSGTAVVTQMAHSVFCSWIDINSLMYFFSCHPFLTGHSETVLKCSSVLKSMIHQGGV